MYQCGHLVKGVDQELKVQFTLMGRGGGSSREIELDCVCLFAGVRAGGHKPGFRSSGALCSAYEIW